MLMFTTIFPNIKETWNFYVPYMICNTYSEKAVSELGENMNLMPLSLFKNSRNNELKPISFTIYLTKKQEVWSIRI